MASTAARMTGARTVTTGLRLEWRAVTLDSLDHSIVSPPAGNNSGEKEPPVSGHPEGLVKGSGRRGKPKSLPTAGMPADMGAHKDHQVFPHRHVPVEGVRKDCSGRWLCESCHAWFGGKPCHEAK